LVAALALLVDATVSLVAPDALSDHSAGPGRLSELMSGLAFLAMAVALVPLAPEAGRRRWLFSLAPMGLALCGLAMVGVVLTGHEPPLAVFLVSVLTALVGCVTAAFIGHRDGTWPWWTAAGVALVLPVLFLAPLNSLVLALVWVLVAVTTRVRGSSDGRAGHR
jgi:hypothetical protein